MTRSARVAVLYITYDGLLEPLGQSQVLGYMERLAREWPVYILSYEKRRDREDQVRMAAMRERLVKAGITWTPLAYHESPSVPATAYDIALGTFVAVRLALRHKVGILHARSYVPALIALGVKRLTGVKFLFDMRGFWADERVDGGLWPQNGRLFRAAKSFERRFLLAADHVVSLTHAAVREMQNFPYLRGRMPPTTVIPTCADLLRFKPTNRTPSSHGFVMGYVGTVGTWRLFNEVAASFSHLLRIRPDARFLILNRGEHAYIRERLAANDVPPSSVTLIAATHDEVPGYMARMDAGIFFIKPTFSAHASAPTKLAEFLGCGVPCLGNAGVGDMAVVLEGERVGVALRRFDEASLLEGLQQLLRLAADPDTGARCVAAARRHFSLDEGVAKYRTIYQGLSE
jgi:glycosyltransferase involved in cell wall biosynthesis